MRVVILVTCPKKAQARAIARVILRKKLAACVNVIGGVESLFWWQGKIDSAAEVLLVIKSRRSLVPALCAAIKAVHSYTVPEIIALPIVAGERAYLRWIDESVRKSA